MNLHFELTEQETNVVLQALAAQPYSAVAALIQKIHTAAQSQLKPAEPAKDE